MSEQLDIRIEVDETSVLMVLPRVMDDWMCPWQQAWRLGEVLELAARDIPTKDSIYNPKEVETEQGQIALNTHQDKYVVLLFRHTDRIRLSYHAALLVARAIRMKAQDLDYLNTKKIRLKPSQFFKQRKLPI